MDYKISDIIKIFINNHAEIHKDMQKVDHAYNGEGYNVHHLEGSIWTHTCMVMKEAQNADIVQKLAALCHDLGKPYVHKDVEYDDKPGRRRFTQHEAVSTFYAKEVLRSFDITKEQEDAVLRIVSQHGSLYNFFEDGRIPKENHIRIAERFNYSDFADLAQFYKYDHEGRFFCDEASGGEKGIYDDFENILDVIQLKDDIRAAIDIQKMNAKKLVVLIGPPRVGKTTWRDNRLLGGETTVISRDDLVEKLGTGETYSDKFNSIDKDLNKQIDQTLQKNYQDALRANKNIVIDMTNMSKKSRKKWLQDDKATSYSKEAVVFVESKSCLLSRNSPEKTIAPFIISMFMKNFVFPNYEEFNKITIN